MPEFLAETCAPRDASGAAARRAGEAALAQIRLRYPIAVPEEETCFCLDRAPSARAKLAAPPPGRLSSGTRSHSLASSEPVRRRRAR